MRAFFASHESKVNKLLPRRWCAAVCAEKDNHDDDDDDSDEDGWDWSQIKCQPADD